MQQSSSVLGSHPEKPIQVFLLSRGRPQGDAKSSSKNETFCAAAHPASGWGMQSDALYFSVTGVSSVT